MYKKNHELLIPLHQNRVDRKYLKLVVSRKLQFLDPRSGTVNLYIWFVLILLVVLLIFSNKLRNQ